MSSNSGAIGAEIDYTDTVLAIFILVDAPPAGCDTVEVVEGSTDDAAASDSSTDTDDTIV